MNEYPKPATKESTKKILEQIDNTIYKIYESKENFSIGFFCLINFRNENIKVFVTTYKAIDEKYIEKNNNINLSIKDEIITIKFGKIKYINKFLDLSVIEIEEKDNQKLNILEKDESLFDKKEKELMYYKESMYIIHCNEDKEKCVSYGIINNVQKSKLICSCNINSNSNGAPIFDLSNNKLIGIYKKNDNYYAEGISFGFIVDEFIKELKNYKQILKYDKMTKNEIDIYINIEKEDVNKQVYFLNNYDTGEINNESIDMNNDSEDINILNDENTEVYINKEKREYKKYFVPEKKGKYVIKLMFYMKLIDASYMFAGCEKITKINFISFHSIQITNMKYMFGGCKNLENVNLFSFDTRIVTNMSYMFYHCYELKTLDLSSFNTKNVKDMCHMFSCCKSLKDLNISSFDIKNDVNTNYKFLDCWNLNNLDITFLNIEDSLERSNILLNRSDINRTNSISQDLNMTNNEIYLLINIEKEDINIKIIFLQSSNM